MRHANKQQGMVLPTAMIMLVMLLLVAIVSFNMGRQHTIIAGNMQNRAEALTVANQAVEQVISKTDFIADPSAALPNNQVTYDVNGDGKDDVAVTLSPKPCIKKAQAIKNADLDVKNSEDAACMTGAAQNIGVEGAVGGDSLCANTIWEINAVAVDATTGTQAAVTTGVGVRVNNDSAINAANICS